uniref:SAM domain-containing protein n=1 Tax=Macrostomum lignano TaxID=282301 RepID=A0A1I8FJN3_9PLAT
DRVAKSARSLLAWAPPLLLPTPRQPVLLWRPENWCGKSAENRLHRRDELLGPPGTTRMPQPPQLLTTHPRDILIWLENCDDAEFYSLSKTTYRSHVHRTPPSPPPRHLRWQQAGAAAVRKKPALRRLFSRESRSFCAAEGAAIAAAAAAAAATAVAEAIGTKRLQYSELVSEEAESGDESDHSDLWKEMQSAVSRLREDRHSICPETVVAMDQPLLLTDGQDVLRFVRQLQLDGHLGQMMRANSMPT